MHSYEKDSREMYETGLWNEHLNVTVEDSGLVVAAEKAGCLEIKCPFCCKDMFILKLQKTGNFAWKNMALNTCKLSRKHPYY